jgi:hydroxymethylbilane synthase
VELRGNMASRLAAVNESGIDAVVAAAAALDRLGWNDKIAERLDPEWFTPQVGQGAIALETLVDAADVHQILASIHDADAARRLTCERAFLEELGAGCTIPAAAHATLLGDEIQLDGVMASPTGARVIRHRAVGTDAAALGASVAAHIRDELGGGNLPTGR